jgi:hypothetical protein
VASTDGDFVNSVRCQTRANWTSLLPNRLNAWPVNNTRNGAIAFDMNPGSSSLKVISALTEWDRLRYSY